ncbi:MAG TPA: FAD-dependent oxidoreductase, partial [Aggregatilineales bacterium]|nr:FAD-dependent oxidoreductase [Aggregatilineales bacterium]
MPMLESVLTALMKMTAPPGYPVSLEKLDIDDNNALWTDYTPDYQPAAPLKEDRFADLVIIGGGFTGVSTAYHFSERYPEKRVILLEARTLANGASGRNGGMMLNRINGTEHLDDAGLVRVYNTTNYGIDRIIGIIQKHQLKVNYRRDGSLKVFTKPESAAEGQREVERLSALGIPYQYLDAAAVRKMINLQGIIGGIFDPNEGQLNGAQYVRALRGIILDRGVEIFENTPVLKIEPGAEIVIRPANA